MNPSDWIAKVIYDDTIEIEFGDGEVAMPAWGIDDRGIGGSDESADGIPESFEIRWDNVVNVRLPFPESALANVRRWFRWAQTQATSFEFWFNKDDEDTAYDVYLESPKLGEGGFKPVRDQGDPGWFWLDVSLRTANGDEFDVGWAETIESAVES